MGKNGHSMMTSLSQSHEDIETKKQKIVAPYKNKEIFFHILTRISVQSLFESIRYVCKPWYNLISNPLFIDTHLRKSKCGLIIHEPQSNGGRLITMQVVDTNGEWKIEVKDITTHCMGLIRGSCNGLLLLQDRVRRQTLYVKNPITKQFISLPICSSPFSFKQHICCYGLTYVSSSNEYKVVHLFDEGKSHGFIGCEILSLGSLRSMWKRVNKPTFRSTIMHGFRSSMGVSANGVLHWDVPSLCFIVSFDVKAETFRETAYPNTRIRTGIFMELRGCLALVDWVSSSKLEIWVLKDIYSGKWARQQSIELECFKYSPMSFNPIGILENGEVIVFRKGCHKYGEWFAYNFRVKQIKGINIKWEGIELCVPYVESLVSLT